VARHLRPRSDAGRTAYLLERLGGVSGLSVSQARVAGILLDTLVERLGLRAADDAPSLGGPYDALYGRVLPLVLDQAAAILRGDAPAIEAHALYVQPGTALLRPGKMLRVVSLNDANAAALATLPPLPPRAARRLLAKRPPDGYVDVAAARRASGLTRAEWAEVEPFLRVQPPSPPREAPAPRAFRTLVADVRQGTRTLPSVASGAPASEVLIEALRACVRVVVERSTVPAYWSAGPRRLVWTTRGVAGVEPRVSARQVGLLRNASYLDALRVLLAQARRRILVSMFFYTVEPGTPGAEWLALLAQARARGVDVRVLLADGLPGSRHGAERINVAAERALRRERVAVRRYWPEVTLHRKLVLIDDDHTLCGSHNWTTSSAYRYDETSVLVLGVELTSALAAEFERDWAMVASRQAERRVPLAALEQIGAAARRALEAAGISYVERLPDAPARVRALARAAGCSTAELRRWRDVARLMVRLRIAEPTATGLVTAGVPARGSFGRTARARAAVAFDDTSRWPAPLTDRRVDPSTGSYVARRMR
jgi:hypothetical protein